MSRRKKRSNQPSQVPPLDTRHYLAIELLLDFQAGLSREEIAKECGVSRMQLFRWEKRKDFQREKDKRFKQKLDRMIPKKNRSYASLALSGDVKAAETILGAAGLTGNGTY
ncbi:phBC6A51 family helix-turn-helix protein [Rossellomorea sp. GCM10028870]|uniref:phBC6A51 family helix-turn-helix protein n=1 Tax=Rossellomorea sp. GCM10028870 TaxID=3273426 RepID=UPI00361D3FCC